MAVSEDAFWTALRHSVAEAEKREREELAAAERLLAEVDDAPLEDERIAAIVQRATAVADVADEDVAAGDVHDVDQAPAPIRRFPRLPRFVAAAAALVVGPKFLVAASVVTFVAVTAYMVVDSRESLPFQDAVTILIDEREPEANRLPAQGRVYFRVVESIGVVRAVIGEPGVLTEQAQGVLRSLQATLQGAEPFVPRRISTSLDEVMGLVLDRSLDVAERQEALDRLEDLMVYGVLALKEIERLPGPSTLKRDNALWLSNWGKLLE